jgi:hypothetical protein
VVAFRFSFGVIDSFLHSRKRHIHCDSGATSSRIPLYFLLE